MSGRKGHISGKKQRGSHTTITPMAERLVKAANKLPYVTGINPGRIEQAKTRLPRVNFEATHTGLKAVVLSATTKQTLYILTTCPLRVEKKLKAALR